MSDDAPTFQITADPLEIVIFAGADRWTLQAAAKTLGLVIDWWHAYESATCAERDRADNLDLERDNYERATLELAAHMQGLVYGEGDTGLS